MAKVTVTSKEEKQEEVLLSGTLDSTSPLNALFPSLQKKQEELTNMQEHYLEILKSIARSKESIHYCSIKVKPISRSGPG
jgi:hypothetical protein